MKYYSYTIKELKSKLDDIDFWKSTVLPITPYRAHSQIKNPKAEDSDICLIVARDGEKINGYIGILPDYIFIGEKKRKIGILSSWWVDQNYKSILKQNFQN